MTTSNLRYPLFLHLVVFLFGFTGILGKLITLTSDWLVWYRMAIAFVGLAIFGFISGHFKVPAKKMVTLWGIGGITAFHWICFFEAIKLTNVSVALACVSSSAFFTAALEPLFFRQKVKVAELVLGLFVIVGVSLMFQVEAGNVWGIIVAVTAAFLAAFFTVLNGIQIKTTHAVSISIHEMLGGVGVISIYFLITGKWNSFQIPGFNDTAWLLVLGLVCTAFAYVMATWVMKQLSPFTVAMAVNLEPIYAIIMAFIFFNEYEEVNIYFYLGTVIILASVFAKSIFAYLRKQKQRFKKAPTLP